MTKKSKYFIIAFLLGLAAICQAQDFKVSATLDTVPATGFYKILITPALTASARTGFPDIRITEQGGNNVPYIIQNTAMARKDTLRLNDLKILSCHSEKNFTTVILGSIGSTWASGISLIMNNTAVERYVQVSGSNDNENWYIIDDHVILQKANANNTGNYVQNISLPENRYSYFKLKINNAHTDPLNITGAKTFNTPNKAVLKPEMQDNPTPQFRQVDSNNHKSYIIIRNNAPFLVNEIDLSVKGAKFYDRNMTAYVLPSDKDSGNLNNPVASFSLSSTKPAMFSLPVQKAQALILEIENKDNPPLNITNVTTLQEKHYLISWLEKGKKYLILAASDDATAPQYDLSKFSDSIPANLPVLSYGAFSRIPLSSAAPPKPITHTYWLWIVIVISITVLGTLTYRLMKDINKNEQG